MRVKMPDGGLPAPAIRAPGNQGTGRIRSNGQDEPAAKGKET